MSSTLPVPAYETPPIKKGIHKKVAAIKIERSSSGSERPESVERLKDPTAKLVSFEKGAQKQKIPDGSSSHGVKPSLKDLEIEKLRRLSEIQQGEVEALKRRLAETEKSSAVKAKEVQDLRK